MGTRRKLLQKSRKGREAAQKWRKSHLPTLTEGGGEVHSIVFILGAIPSSRKKGDDWGEWPAERGEKKVCQVLTPGRGEGGRVPSSVEGKREGEKVKKAIENVKGGESVS